MIRFDHGPLPGGTIFEAPQAVIRADTAAGVKVYAIMLMNEGEKKK